MTPRPTLICTLTALLLTGCGGGGGGSTPSSQPPPAVNQDPIGAFTVTPSQGPAPLNVTVDASGSTDPEGGRLVYLWDFGADAQAAPSIGRVARYTYSEPGSYTIRLQVADGAGGIGTAQRSVTVTAAGVASLNGSIQILASSAIDRDVNDRLTTPAANDDFTTAQRLSNPAIVGGFANQAGTGESTGNFFAAGDPGDFYQITLAGSERIQLSIADPDADLDLRLWDSAQQLVDASVGATGSESLSASAPGSHFIEVVSVAGSSNYVLTVGQEQAPLARSATRLSDPFLPGEAVVHSTDPQLGARHGMVQRYRSGRFAVFDVNTPLPEGPLGKQPALPPGGALSRSQMRRYDTLLALKRLATDPAVDTVEPNLLRFALRTPDDPFYAYQWHYESINLPLAWDITTASEDPNRTVRVAVIDTGILAAHPDLRDQVSDGYDFISNPDRAGDGDGIDPDPEDAGDLAYGGGSSFHGTHVAGTVAARTGNATGVAGIAWGAKVMPLRVLGIGGGTSYDVAQAIRYAAGLSNDSGRLPPRPADVINLSLGSSFSSQVEQDAITEARAAGCIVVASAGNDGSELPVYPAAYDGVIGVSATTIARGLASYSNFGASVDIAAPGGDTGTDLNADGIGDGVVSTLGESGRSGAVQFTYSVLGGTSMAAPHVSGVAALMKSVHPALTPREFELALLAGDLTDDLGPAGRDDRYGNGLLNAQRAVLTALRLATGQGSDPGPLLSASASTLNFGPFANVLPLTLQNAGTGSPRVLNVTSTEPWLDVQPTSLDENGLGTYEVVVDRTGLADALYTADLTIDSDANDLNVRVLMQVSSLDLTADAGLHYVILVDALGQTAGPAALVSAQGGGYQYTIRDVPAGQYRIFAGTDSDDDSFLCDAGEACGAYPTLDQPETISVNGNRDGLNFLSGFKINLTGPTASAQRIGAQGIPFSRPPTTGPTATGEATR